MASNIYRWVTNNFNVTTQQMETYNDQMPDDVITDDSLPELEMSSDDDDEDNIMNRVDHWRGFLLKRPMTKVSESDSPKKIWR